MSRIFLDKKSGKDFERTGYQQLIREMREGDVLFILSLDRLGRDYREVQTEWRRITHEIGADIVVIDMPLLDTRRCRDLLGTFISDLVLQVLSFAAQMEREHIRERQAQGIAAARARGVCLGRRPQDLPLVFDEIRVQWEKGIISLRAAAEACGLPKSTFYYHVRQHRAMAMPGRAIPQGPDE